MKKIIVYTFLLSIVFACQEAPTKSNPKDTERISELESQIKQIKFDEQQKDLIIDESLIFFDEVQANLATIEFKKNEIKALTETENLTSEDKNWIIEQIKHIQSLREINTRKINLLSKKVFDSNIKINELNSMIERLALEIQDKDNQLVELEDQLMQMDKQYSQLFDEYLKKTSIAEELENELNRVFYTYGSEKELIENHVLQKKNGILGIGKKIYLSDAFNEKHFTEINRLSKTELMIEGQSLKLITNHPISSYELIPNGNTTKLTIKNPTEFWKISKYLVITSDVKN
jgi:chromosome segregation ATPase